MPNRRLAIVTGTSSGIGEQVARQLLQRGWEVIGIARRTVAINTPGYTHCPLDLGDVARLTQALETKLGPRVRDGALGRSVPTHCLVPRPMPTRPCDRRAYRARSHSGAACR